MPRAPDAEPPVRHALSSLLAVVVALAALLVPAASSSADDTGPYAPLDERGPRLQVPRRDLRAALECDGPLRRLDEDPVLLVPGTSVEPDPNFDWNYMPALEQLGRRWCAVTLPYDTTGDIQVAGEYVVFAIRWMERRAKRDVDVVGYSQGGMVPRWALRFWPDTRDRVDDVIGLSPSNHGTLDSEYCGSCIPAYHQQQASAHFIDALNSGAETFAGIDYTVAYTYEDEVVVPNTPPAPSSALRGGEGDVANIATQQVCPNNVAEHFEIGTSDPVGWALVRDALVHDGPADIVRTLRHDPLLCTRTFMPGVDAATYAQDFARFVTFVADSDGDAAKVMQEPPLRPYVTAD